MTIRKSVLSLLSMCSIISVVACNNNATGNVTDAAPATSAESVNTTPAATIPSFDAQQAYDFIAKQVSFGPRVPGTPAQKQCAAWMESQLQLSCDTVYKQSTTVLAGDGKTKLPCINLIGVINPQATKRILLLAHWDSRPWSDQDKDHPSKPIDGANDGASGVGVLLALVHRLKAQPLPSKDLGIDILLTDVEDWGKSEWGDESYALGTQYWAKNPHIANYTAQAGILLDMVGGKNARFPIEGYSAQYAMNVVRDVWAAARVAGYTSFFVQEQGGAITDDHVPVIKYRGIPTIDIIDLPAQSANGFPAHWHTQNDNISVIDTLTLKAVGQTLLQYLYTQ
jgi:glutaminyl-peptide cyclotransferase